MAKRARKQEATRKQGPVARAPLVGDHIIARNIKRALDAAGISPAEFARRLQITPQAVSQWLNAQTTPGGKRLRQIAFVLKVSTEFFRQAPEVPEAVAEQPPKSAPLRLGRDSTVRLRAYPLGGVPAESARAEGWPLPAEWFQGLASDQADLAVMRVTGGELRPDFAPGEIVVVDRNWHLVSVEAYYLTGDRSFPVLRRCELVAGPEAQVRVYEHGTERVMSAADLPIFGRVICRWLVPL